MNIRQQVREVEKHIKAMANEKDEQIKIISTAQGVIAINKPGTVEEKCYKLVKTQSTIQTQEYFT